MKVLDYRAVRKGCVQASFNLELPSGLIICQCALFEKDGKRWISGPSKKIGEKYQKCLDFTSREVADKFGAAALLALDAHLATVNQ